MFLRRPCFSMCPRRKRRIFCLSQMLCGKKKLPHFPPRNYFFCTNPPSVGCLAHSPWFCFILEVFCIFFRNPKMKNAESNRRFSFLFLSVLWSNFGFYQGSWRNKGNPSMNPLGHIPMLYSLPYVLFRNFTVPFGFGFGYSSHLLAPRRCPKTNGHFYKQTGLGWAASDQTGG